MTLELTARLSDHLGGDVGGDQRAHSRRDPLAELSAAAADLEHVHIGAELLGDELVDDRIGKLWAAPFFSERFEVQVEVAVAAHFFG